MFREKDLAHEVFLVHPGGPYWTKKHEGAWTVPKGEFEEGEEPLAAAQREFTEETGFLARGPFMELGSVRQKSGKIVHAWAFAGECDPSKLVSNTCEIEWPPHSKRHIVIPEVDRGAWFAQKDAIHSIRGEQQPFLARLEGLLHNR
jgi:predicted NUDIX family NTP pyrophosphohydrolase